MDDRTEPRRQDRAGRLDIALSALYFAARREYRTDLTHRAIRVLQMVSLSEVPPRIDDFARFLGCAPSTASELIKRLQLRGLVVRTRSESDERVVEVGLTAAGHAALDEHTSLNPGRLADLLGRLSDTEQEELIRLCEKMADGG